MTKNTRKDSVSSPVRRSTRSASRPSSAGTQTSASRDVAVETQVSTERDVVPGSQTPARQTNTPKFLTEYDWNAFDPTQFNTGAWDGNPDLGLDLDANGGFDMQGGYLDTQPLNLLQNPLSAVPGAVDFNLNFDGFEDYSFTSLGQPSQHYAPLQAATPISPSGRRRSSRSASRVQLDEEYGRFGDNFEFVQLGASASPTARRTPWRGVPQAPMDDGYEPIDPQLLGNGSYASDYLGQANDYPVFIPETRPSPHQSLRSQRSPTEGVDDDRRRKSTSYHSSRRSQRSDSYPASRSSRSNQSDTNDRGNRKSVFQDTFKYEKPKADTQKPWIRTNGTTKGLTTRTAKCNSYDPNQHYMYTPPPLGDWSSRRNDFQYTKHGELSDATYTAEQIRDFILNYPEDKHNKIKLQLFIQVGPTDSARRYLSQTWAKCRFRECPVNIYEKGTILHGHYRVGFDERSYGTNNRYDPHLASSAYVHLYCLERFLDFEYLCRKAHVHVDTRQYSTEPKGKFHATLSGRPECGIAQDFVKYASRGTLRESMPEFAEYPIHSDYAEGEPKPHEHTLTAHMHKVKAATRPAAQIQQFEARGLKPSHILVNKGDLEVLMSEKRRAKEKKAKDIAKRKREDILQDDSDDEDVGNQAYNNKRRRLVAEAKTRYNTSRRRKPARATRQTKEPEVSQAKQPWEVDDDEDSLDENQPITPRPQNARRSARHAGQQVSYNENANELNIPTGYQPAQDHLQGTTPPPDPTQRSNSVYIDPELEGVDLDALFKENGLDRRSSSIAFSPLRTGSILRSANSRSAGPRSAGLSSAGPRSATLRSASSGGSKVSFADQPVSSSHIFDTRAPPREFPLPAPRRIRLRSDSLKKKEH